MKSALAIVLGVSVLALGAGCDSAGDDPTGTGGKIAVGGSSATTAGTGTTGGSGGMAGPTDGVAIIAADGWVAVDSNSLGIEGALFAYGDAVSLTGMVQNFMGPNACITGTAAEVKEPCEVVAPATDCYGTFWGAAIGLNLKQPKDPLTGMGVKVALPFDASALKGFRFTIDGMKVPTTLRFKVEDSGKEYCTWKTIMSGVNTVLFNELETECWNHSKKPGTSAETAKSGIIKIAWQTVTKKGATIPFDYCVKDIVALTSGAPPTGTGGSGSGGSGSGTAGAPSGGSGGAAAGAGGAAAGAGGAAAGSGGAAAGSGGSGGA